jgi:hypothetical protein
VFDQADFFESDGFTRQPGLTLSQLILQLFFDNQLQPWPLVTGVGVTDSQVAAGYVYLIELPAGFYNVRWFPNAVGYWRMLLTYTAGQQIECQDYDVVQTLPVTGAGLTASFIKQPC